MRILMIADHADPLSVSGSQDTVLGGGQYTYLIYLTKFLSQLGVYIDVYTRWDSKSKKEIGYINKRVRVIRVQAGSKEPLLKEKIPTIIDELADNIIKQIAKEKTRYDIIHSNYWFSGLIALKVSAALKLPVVHVYHSIGKVRLDVLKQFQLHSKDKQFFRKRLAAEQLIADKVQGIIATSPIEKRLMRKFYHVKEKIKVIPIGVDQAIFYPVNQIQARKQLGWPQSQHIILYVGRLDWRKGVDTLLHALQLIVKIKPQYQLYIIGGEQAGKPSLNVAEQHRLQSTLVQLKLQKHVHFLGPKQQSELRYYYSAADVTAVPSYYEPFGIVALESMACGTPLVASHTGGLTYIVADKITGYLAEPINPADVARKIRLVIQQGKKKFTYHCVQRVQENFSWKDIAQEYVKYFNRLIKQP